MKRILVLVFDIFLILNTAMWGLGEPQVAAKVQKQGLLVIPGVGRADRLVTILHNLKALSDHLIGANAPWDCMMYVYAPRNDTSFWSSSKRLSIIATFCDIVDHPNKRVTENLYAIHPTTLDRGYNNIFILFDDCKLESRRTPQFPLQYILQVMQFNNLTVASPRVMGANVGGGQAFRTIMQVTSQPGTIGYISSFVEMFAWVMTPTAYRALWELLYPSINPYGWGYDLWYDNYATQMVPGHRMGIISNIVAKHDQDFSLV